MSTHSSNSQYTQWRRQCKHDIAKSAKENILARLNKIGNIIKEHTEINEFELSSDATNQILRDVNDAISSWRGVEHESCKTMKKTFKEYKRTAINWFNRNKAKIFGTFLFYPLIFGHILSLCRQLNNGQKKNDERMRIFIELFQAILSDNIQFKKTKSQPLIPYQTLIVPNKFKVHCMKLVEYYNISWDLRDTLPAKISSVYQKDKCRAKKTTDSFIKTLTNIYNALCSTTTIQRFPCFHDDNEYKDISMKGIKEEDTRQNMIKEEHMLSVSPPSSDSDSMDQMVSNNNNNKNIKTDQVKQHENKLQYNQNISNIPISGLMQSNNNNNLNQEFNGISELENNITCNIPVHVVQNGQVSILEMARAINSYESIDINDFNKLEHDVTNNKVFGYKIEHLNHGKGPLVIKQYILFPNQI